MNTITKRCAALLLSTALLVPLLAPSSRAATSVNVSVNGTPVAFSSATGTPFLDQNGRTQVPLRVTMEALGATVGWDNSTRTATVSKGSVSIRIPIGTSFILVNGVKKSNDTTAQIVNGRTYLPIRIVAESLSATVNWDNSTKSVQITAKGTPKIWLLTKESCPDVSDPYTLTYSYDTANRLTSKTRSSSHYSWVYSYAYNSQNQAISETGKLTSENYGYTTTYQYNNWGLLSYQKTIRSEFGDQYQSEEAWFEYNDKGDITKELHHYTDTDFSSWRTTNHTYTYDKNGRITKEVVLNPAVETQDTFPDKDTFTYTYNSVGELTKRYLITEYKGVEEDGSNYYEHVTTNFTYDKNGNLTKESVVFGTDIISRADYYYTYTQR